MTQNRASKKVTKRGNWVLDLDACHREWIEVLSSWCLYVLCLVTALIILNLERSCRSRRCQIRWHRQHWILSKNKILVCWAWSLSLSVNLSVDRWIEWKRWILQIGSAQNSVIQIIRLASRMLRCLLKEACRINQINCCHRDNTWRRLSQLSTATRQESN